jgi:hypothetical protein
MKETLELHLETVFFTRSVQSGYEKDNGGEPFSGELKVGLQRKD